MQRWKESVRIIAKRAGRLLIILITVTCLPLFITPAWPARYDSGEDEESYSTENAPPIPSITQIESAIVNLNSTSNSDAITWIEGAISKQAPKEQEHLNRALEIRLKQLEAFEEANQPESGSVERPESSQDTISEDLSFEGIQEQIDNLNLGPEATVEDIRKRDKVIAGITNLKNPDQRKELLDYLEAREKEETPAH